MHDFVEGASVQPLDDDQRFVRRIADGEEVGQEASFGKAQNGPGLVLVGGRGVSCADAQVGCGNGHRVRGLTEVVLEKSRLPIVLRLCRNDGDRGRRATDGESASPPAVVPCTACDAGTAGLFTCITEGTKSMVTYVCRNCGHQFDRIW